MECYQAIGNRGSKALDKLVEEIVSDQRWLSEDGLSGGGRDEVGALDLSTSLIESERVK